MFRFNKSLGLILIVFILLIVIPSSFAHENETVVSIDANVSPVEIASDDILKDVEDLYFDASAENDSGNGSADSPFKYLNASEIKDNSNIHLAEGEYALDKTITIGNVNFIGSGTNKTILRYDGIAFRVSNALGLANLTIDGASIVNNAKLSAANTVFSNAHARPVDNYGNDFGGAIYCTQSTAETYLANCTFLNNYAEYGGAIYCSGGKLDIIDTMFINNYAYNFGGSIACEKSSKVSISKSKFFNSSSKGDAGGAIYLKSSSLKINDVEIADSHATFGGAIASLNTAVNLTGLNVHDSSAIWDGGAVYHMYGSFSSLYGNFTNNSAETGGALFIDGSNSLDLRFNSFSFNNAGLCAGAVYCLCNTLKSNFSIASDNTFTANSAAFRNDEYEISSVDLNIAGGNYTMYKNNDTVSELPSYYNSRDYGLISIAKDQQTSGNCWAFASISVLESAIAKASGTSIDLSEENMKNIITKYSDYGWDMETNEGGYENMPFGYLVSWLGPVLESDDPFDDKGTLSPVLESVMHVQNIAFLKRDNYTDNDAVKRAVMQYGSVGTFIGFYSSYLNYQTNAYYYNGNDGNNHVVAIVGWNDSYSKSNFKNSASIAGDGAWIAKNSWGPSWGNQGYFYISYYDKLAVKVGVEDAAYAFILNDTIRYDRNYQYDIAGMTDYYYFNSSEVWYRNVFQSLGEEYLAGISTYFERTTDWSASVFVNGILKLVQSGTSNAGYYTIELDQFIHLNAGDVFEVVFRIGGLGSVAVPISEKISLNKETYAPGISFVSFDGDDWQDLYNRSGTFPGHTYGSQVACIKAFTFKDLIATAIDFIASDESGIAVKVQDQYGNLLKGSLSLDINGYVYDLSLENGAAVLTNPLLNQTVNIVTAIFNKSGYLQSTSSKTIYLNKTNINLSMTISQISNRASVYLESSDNINTSMMVKVNDKRYRVIFSNGRASLNLTDLENGNYSVEVLCEDLSAYHFDNLSDSFIKDVKKTRIISDDLIVCEGNGSFNITLADENGNSLADKELTVLINNQTFIERTDLNGSISVGLNLTYGNYSAEINFKGDSGYVESSKSNNISVKIDICIEVSIDRIQNDVSVNVGLSKMVNESLTLTINNETYVINSTEGNASLELVNLANGIYNVTVSLNDLDTFICSPVSFTFVVDVKSTQIESSNLIINDEDDFTFNVTLTDENGIPLDGKDIIFILNGTEYNSSTDSDGVAFIPLDLASGEYKIIIAFNGDNDYYATGAVNFIKVRTKVKIDLFAYVYQDEALIGINVSKPVNDSAIVIFNENSNVLDLINGSALIILTDLANGNYTVVVGLYADDYDFSPVGLMFPIDVKRTKIISDDLTVCEASGMFNITLADENDNVLANKKLLITLNNETFITNTDSDGSVSIPLNLTYGNYSAEISFDGDLNYYAVNKSNIIKVKKDIGIGVSVERHQNNVAVNVTLSKPVNESLTVTVNGKRYSLNSTNGSALLELFNLSNGIYDVNVSMDDFEAYNAFPANLTFLINVKHTQVISDNLTVNDEEDSAFKVLLADENGIALANKTVTFILNNLTYEEFTDTEGIASISIDLAGGEYEIDVYFNGDNDYFASAAFNVIRVKTKVDIQVSITSYQNNAQVSINASKPLNESIIVNVNEKSYNVTLTNGKALLELYNLTNNIYEVNVSLDENDYEFVPITSTFIIDVCNTEIQSENMAVNEGDEFAFNATLTDENGIVLANKSIRFVLNNVTYERVTDEYGVAFIRLNLTNGKYDIAVNFIGDWDYFASYASNVIDVRTDVNISVSVDIRQSNAVISINMSKPINDTLSITVKDKKYNVNVKEGKASLVLFDFSDDETDFAVNFDNDNYNSAVNSTITHGKINETSEPNNTFNLTVVDENNSVLANREVSIVLDDINYVLVSDDNGQVSIPVDLSLGDYSVDIYVKNEDNVFELVKSESVAVKSKVIIGYDIENHPDKSIITVNLSKAINATLEIVVDGKSYKLPVSSKTMSLPLSDLDSGIHNIEIAVVEDDIFEFNRICAQFNVTAISTKILAGDMTTYAKSAKEYAVTLTDEFGKPLSGKVIRFAISDKLFTKTTDENGQAAVNIDLPAGDYEVSLIFDGDSRYVNSSNSSKISVKSTVILNDSLTKTCNAVYSYKLLDLDGNPLKNAKVEFSIDNVTHTSISDSEGVVSVKITKQSGSCNLIVYNPLNNESSQVTINVSKRISQNKDIVIYEYSASVYKVLVLDDNGNPESAGKIVTFKIFGSTYYVKTDKNGYAGLKISLKPKKGTVTVTYNGFKVSNKITVKSVLSAKNIAKKKAKSYKFQAKLVSKKGKALKGKKLTFKIKGKKYTAKTNKKGVATITIRLPLKVGSYKIYTIYGKSRITNTLKIKR